MQLTLCRSAQCWVWRGRVRMPEPKTLLTNVAKSPKHKITMQSSQLPSPSRSQSSLCSLRWQLWAEAQMLPCPGGLLANRGYSTRSLVLGSRRGLQTSEYVLDVPPTSRTCGDMDFTLMFQVGGGQATVRKTSSLAGSKTKDTRVSLSRWR